MTPATKAAREAVARILERLYGFGDFVHLTAADAILSLPEVRAAFAGEWLPIETAPADTEILIYCPHRHVSNPERVEAGVYRDIRGGWTHSWATHWRPLPTPPSEPSNG